MLISLIGAPQASNALLNPCLSANVSPSAGETSSADPPPEQRDSEIVLACIMWARFRIACPLPPPPHRGPGDSFRARCRWKRAVILSSPPRGRR
ncbi:MAG: hypothetical protein R2873_05715 [Caldilineaceae bacterium]